MKNILKNKNGFTLAEILGVIVIVGLLLVIVSPLVVNRINSEKELVSSASEELIFNATSQFVEENQNIYLLGNKYCISIKSLVNNGKLSHPVLDVVTGKNIEDMYVLVVMYKTGLIDYKILDKDDCENNQTIPISNQKPEIRINSNCNEL